MLLYNKLQKNKGDSEFCSENAHRAACIPGVYAETLCIIPARRGSKGIKLKNIRELAGKPLIAYSIEAALRVPSITRTTVSTDDEHIAEVARSYGAEVPMLRPSELATDHAVISSAVDHMLDELRLRENYRPQAMVTLYPTSPLRNVDTLKMLVSKLFEGYLEVVTVKNIDPTLTYLYDRGNGLEALQTVFDATHSFRPYGYFYGKRLDYMGERRRYIHLLDSPEAFVDIDTPEDLEMAKRILERGLLNFS